MFCDSWKLYKIHISMSLNKILLEHSHTHILLSIICGCFPLRNGGVEAERSSWEWDHKAYKAQYICCLDLYRKREDLKIWL